MSGYTVEMRLRFHTGYEDEAKEIIELLERADYRALADVLFTCDSALVNGNAPSWERDT